MKIFMLLLLSWSNAVLAQEVQDVTLTWDYDPDMEVTYIYRRLEIIAPWGTRRYGDMLISYTNDVTYTDMPLYEWQHYVWLSCRANGGGCTELVEELHVPVGCY